MGTNACSDHHYLARYCKLQKMGFMSLSVGAVRENLKNDFKREILKVLPKF
jgi:hypothetical protein